MPFIQFQFRRGTALQWTSANPILAAGEMGIETDTDLFKLGDGVNTWNNLPYGGIQGTPGSTGATGVAGATGATGAAGSTGATGAGATGATGVGATGSIGPQGITGATGATGAAGVGATGATGVAGNLGATGATGVAVVGATGATGAAGDAGAAGATGATGLTGATGATGTQGATGLTGATGAQGSQGVPGESSSIFNYKVNSATSGDPTSQHIIYNAATQIEATALHVSHIDGDNQDINLFIHMLNAGDFIILQDKNASANYQKFLVTGDATEVTNYDVIPVTLSASGGTGTTNFANNHDVLFIKILTGAQGPVGATGATGVAGATGLTGSTGLTGATGTGATGATGATGVAGATGAAGAVGAAGATGATGLTGGASFAVTDSGAGSYTINGGNNPTINLIRGFTYYFNINASGHPFWIKTAQVTGTGSAYSSGVTNNGVDTGTVIFQVPFDAPNTLYYISQFNGTMTGIFNISNLGPVGATGATGATGLTGATGAVGGVPYVFNSSFNDADPGPGELRFNSATVSSVNKVYIDNLDSTGVSQTPWYDTWDDSTASIRGYLLIQSSAGLPTLFSVGGAVEASTGYYKINVTYISGPIRTSGESLSVSFYRTGNNGATGVSGATGATGLGATGATGAQGATGAVGNTVTDIYSSAYKYGANLRVISAATSYTLTNADNGKQLEFTATAAVTVTLPTGLEANFSCTLLQLNTGQVTVSPSGATLNNRSSQTKTAGRYAAVSIIPVGTDSYILAGDTGT